MEHKRKRYGADFKFKVALEAAKERQTMSELTTKFGVHSTQITQWKKQLLQEGIEVFKEGTKGKKDNQQLLLDRLYQQIGQLQVELDWLKKKSGMG
jgi:transposase-like protein